MTNDLVLYEPKEAVPVKEIVRVKSAPGLKWKQRNGYFEARWQCRDDIVARPNFKEFAIKSVKLWAGTGDPTLEEWAFIADTCTQLQQEMLVWANGGLPTNVVYDGTLAGLYLCYRTDPDSNYTKPADRGGLRYASRVHYTVIMGMITKEFGTELVADIKGRTIRRWYDDWSVGGKVASAHTKVKMLRILFGFGTALLEDPECTRLSAVLSEMKFKQAGARTEQLTADQATAIRHLAHERGRPSIAVAQAFQFECMFRQKDCVGEWVPLSEYGMSDVFDGEGMKWLRGIRWEEIDQNLMLTHVTSKKNKEIPINLRNAPMVMEELAIIAGVSPAKVNRDMLPASGPIVVSEYDDLPWAAIEFRRWWRLLANDCEIPKTVRNMDSRAGAISEAEDAEADPDDIRENATHSNVSMTKRYMRGLKEKKVARVQKLRVEKRNRSGTEQQ